MSWIWNYLLNVFLEEIILKHSSVLVIIDAVVSTYLQEKIVHEQRKVIAVL